jgi:hypothetical protein
MLVALGAKPEHAEFRKHALAGMARRVKEGLPAEWHGDPLEFYLRPEIIKQYKGTRWRKAPAKAKAKAPGQPETVRTIQATPVAMEKVPRWLVGDSAQLDKLLPADPAFDLVFTSPPYYDLEVYSVDARDGSTKQTYGQFLDWYAGILAACAARLKPNRFMVLKVGEIRDKHGIYRNFVGDTTTAALKAGLHFYDEIILVTPVGSLPIRAGLHFQATRKIGKTHQNVLVYYKGNPETLNRDVKEAFGEVRVPEPQGGQGPGN